SCAARAKLESRRRASFLLPLFSGRASERELIETYRDTSGPDGESQHLRRLWGGFRGRDLFSSRENRARCYLLYSSRPDPVCSSSFSRLLSMKRSGFFSPGYKSRIACTASART